MPREMVLRFFSRSYSVKTAGSSRVLQNCFRHQLPAIVEHPFNVQMHRGDLNRIVFSDYISADALYLARYGGLMQKLAHHPAFYGSSAGQDLTNIALGVVRTECSMQRRYLRDLPLTVRPVTYEVIARYVKHLKDCLDEEDAPVISLASLLPCFWVYKTLGEAYPVSGMNEEHPYFTWLKTYSSPQFLKGEKQLWDILDAQPMSEASLEKACLAFEQSMRFEKLFFDRVLDISPGYSQQVHSAPDYSF